MLYCIREWDKIINSFRIEKLYIIKKFLNMKKCNLLLIAIILSRTLFINSSRLVNCFILHFSKLINSFFDKKFIYKIFNAFY